MTIFELNCLLLLFHAYPRRELFTVWQNHPRLFLLLCTLFLLSQMCPLSSVFFFFFLIFFNLFYLFLAALGLRFCARAFSSCGKRGPLFITARVPLTIAASPVAEHRLQMRGLSNCGSQAQLLRGMWDPPRPGLEPVSPALAGGFLTTAPPGKSLFNLNIPFVSARL